MPAVFRTGGTMIGMDDEEKSNREERISLDDLLQSCSRITAASLAFPKLSVVADPHRADTERLNRENNVETDEEVLIRRELDMSRWLKGQIDEYQATLFRRKYQNQQRHEDQQQLLGSNSTSSTKATSISTAATEDNTDTNVRTINLFERGTSSLLSTTDDYGGQYPVKRVKQQQQPSRSERELKDELLDITLQRYRENTLLTRIQMSQASMNTSFPNYAATQYSVCDISPEDPIFTSSSTKQPRMESSADQEFLLRKKALSARDFMVLSTLNTTKLLDKSRKSLNDLIQQVSAVQQDNRDLWKELNYWVRQQEQQQQQEEEYTQDCSIRHGADTEADKRHEVASIQNEIDLIENILIHTICGSGIDWSDDDRLRQILDRVQQKQMERNQT